MSATSGTSATVERAAALLRELAGPAAVLRDDQAAAVRAVVDERRRVLVVQRTGWGKSAVYFAAAKILREGGAGTALLISPLLALMRDQIAAAGRMGLTALTINSANVDEWEAAADAVRSDAVDLLAISPERLNNPGFVADVLPSIADRTGLLILDEAHCVSAWGHDFRPDYLRIRSALARLAPGTPVLATTATATDQVVTDLAGQLGVEPMILRGTLDRESLALSVVDLPDLPARLAWLADRIPELTGSGIVYTLTQAMAAQVASWLSAEGVGARAYTGSTPPEERLELEEALRTNGLKVLVATSALGMGYDKPDLGFVVNLGAPSSITAYYQMVGRAGRALERADAVLLPGDEDVRIWRFFDSLSFPPRHLAEAVVGTLERSGRPLSEAAVETRVDIRRSRLSTLLKVLDVEGAVRRVKGGWERTGQPWAYDEERYARVRAARAGDQELMLDYETTSSCRMAHLRAALDDPEMGEGWRCGRCDTCTGRRWPDPAPATLARARGQGGDVPVVLDARRQWPPGLDQPKGRIPEQRRALDGRALGDGGGGRWDPAVAAALDDPSAAGGLDEAIVAVLGAWGWPAGRPTWITWVPSVRRPGTGRAVAERVGTLGRIPVLDVLTRVVVGPPQDEQANSAHACRNVWGAFAFDAGPIPAGPGLVVDDVWSSGWTMTVVADLVAAAGCGPVYPFVLRRGA